MFGRALSRGLMILAIAAMALPMSAATNAVHKSIKINSKTELNGKTLQPGTYELVVKNNQAKFEQKGKVVADAPCSWTTLKDKSAYDALVYSQNNLTGIQFSGKKQAVTFAQTTARSHT